MKKMRKMIALMIAMVMVIGTMSMTAFAAEPREFEGGDFITPPETTISATDIKAGDTVEVIQLVKWDTTAGDWALSADYGVTLAELKNGITQAEATTIANAAKSAPVVATLPAGDDGKVSYDCSGNPGLFYLRAVPAANNKDTVYNPAFVSADYHKGGNTVSFNSKIGSSAVMKRTTIPFDKEVNNAADNFVDVKVGDVIPYIIKTQIPSYGTSFIKPVFTITDTLSTGLELEGNVTVKYGDTTITASDDNVTINATSSGFTVDFKDAYLTGLEGATPAVEVTYSAKVTTEALDNATYMNNKAKLTFTNKPGETVDRDDITRHYTFSLDANLNGGNHGEKWTRELKKVGVKEGTVVTAFTAWEKEDEWGTYGPLAGATFTLTDKAGKVLTASSDKDGYISFKGLDAGEYTLQETAAPEGYVKDGTAHTVVITPKYKEGTDILESYKVTVDGAESAYTIDNFSDDDVTFETIVDNASMTFPIANTEGAELPSTGGIGTTLFYVVGSVLVIGAAVLLISKRRMGTR